MSVVQDKIIFCEGKPDSLDYGLLQTVIGRLSMATPPTIVPAGSKFTFSIFAEGYFSRDIVVGQATPGNQQRYLIFRDRDFDVIPSQTVQLLRLSTQPMRLPMFLTHRATIENYLVDAALIDQYWTAKYQEKVENPSSRWGHKNSPGIPKIAEWIDTSAQMLKDYQSVRWALADLLQTGTARQHLKTTWLKNSGDLPNLLTLQDCQSNARLLINSFRQSLDVVTHQLFEQSVEKYQNYFSQPAFWANREYLIWFHGKDLQKMMQRQQQNYISLDEFFKWAVQAIDVSKHADLVELSQQIEQLSR